MKNHLWYRFAMSALMMGAAQLSLAGAASSGGGAAVVCRNSNNEITSARLLDLFESEYRFGHTVLDSSQSARTILNKVLGRLGKETQAQLYLKEIMAETIQNIKFLPKGVIFASPEDLGPQGVMVLEGCDVEGVGSYEGNRLLVSRSIYNAFSETDKAAFIVHEALYRYNRLFFTRDSVEARKMTGELFATNLSDKEIKNLIHVFYGFRFEHKDQLPEHIQYHSDLRQLLVVNDVKKSSITLKFEAPEVVENPFRFMVYCTGSMGGWRRVLYDIKVTGGEVAFITVPTLPQNTPNDTCSNAFYLINTTTSDVTKRVSFKLSTTDVAEPSSVDVRANGNYTIEDIAPWILYRDIVLPPLPK